MLENGNKYYAFICPLKVFVNIALEWAGAKGMNCFNNYDKDYLVVDDFKSSANYFFFNWYFKLLKVHSSCSI